MNKSNYQGLTDADEPYERKESPFMSTEKDQDVVHLSNYDETGNKMKDNNVTSRLSMAEGNIFDQQLTMACVLYTLAAGSEYWLLSWLNYIYGIKLPILLAIVQNGSWPLQWLGYLRAKKKYEQNVGERKITATMYRSYAILGSLNAVITLTRTLGLTSLPPTIYAIVANTEIVFECIMTKVYLKRHVSNLQICAVSLVIAGVMVSLWNPINGRYGATDDDSYTSSDLLFGVGVSLASRIASSINTILADRFLGKDRKTHMGVLECSFFNAFIPCMTLPLLLTVAPEYQKWGDQLGGRNTSNTLFVTGLLVTVCLAKYVDRVSKFTIVSKASTMFYAVVDSNMKLIAGIGAIIFFHESLTWGQVIGFFIIFLSLLVSLYDKKRKIDSESAVDKQKFVDLK